MSTSTLSYVLKACPCAYSIRYVSDIYIGHKIEIFVIVARTSNGSCAWLCMNCDVHGVLFVRGVAIQWGLLVRVLICFDLHRYCHIPEAIGHVLQAGEQAASRFV
jgi:hypothetical protein